MQGARVLRRPSFCFWEELQSTVHVMCGKQVKTCKLNAMVLRRVTWQPIISLSFPPGVYYLLSTPAPCPAILIFPPNLSTPPHKTSRLVAEL